MPCIDVNKEDLVKRISGRRMCKNGHVFHIHTKPSKVEGICDVCGEELYQRADDCEETVKTRLNAYEESTAKLIDFYGDKGVLCKVNGNQSIDEVKTEILAAIEKAI